MSDDIPSNISTMIMHVPRAYISNMDLLKKHVLAHIKMNRVPLGSACFRFYNVKIPRGFGVEPELVEGFAWSTGTSRAHSVSFAPEWDVSGRTTCFGSCTKTRERLRS